MDYYFTIDGEPFTGAADTGDDAVAKGDAVKKTGIADVESWRLSLDSNGDVVVFGGSKNETDAQAQQETDRIAQIATDKAIADALNGE